MFIENEQTPSQEKITQTVVAESVDTDLELLKKDFGLDAKDDVSLAAMTQPKEKESTTVELVCEQLPDMVQKELAAAIGKMMAVVQDIDQKAQVAVAREASLQRKLDVFIKAEIFVDDTRKKALTEGVESYLGLLAHIRAEIEKDMAFYAPYISETKPAMVTVPAAFAQKSATDFFKAAIGDLKGEIKSVVKYLNVSHSRYMYGFDLQEKSLDALSYRLLSLQRQQKHVAPQQQA